MVVHYYLLMKRGSNISVSATVKAPLCRVDVTPECDRGTWAVKVVGRDTDTVHYEGAGLSYEDALEITESIRDYDASERAEMAMARS